ncbi:actin-like ATPase involved in cell morphogenesis [Paenarthrobacter nitroguajacolicus]|uniref:Hsp70 family protein n=1 Tax=Paenarthrobacter TaxID=1742992 RepID=UPI00285A438F|nr:Hsp70 family protein [Paenarthrobacter nitroguajacolicus]MDR6988042.1 actin-like ATPase involved in cell morphogenesis [Paenarthrobacter nitroguajacolicus]
MSYVLAIDVGTSFTAAALVKPGQGPAPAPEILPLGVHGSAVPSVLFYADDGRVLVGEAAERRGLDDPQRMVREFKRRIGDSVPLAVGEKWLAAEDVYATMARWVVDKAREREGTAPSSIIMTHPAAWGQHRTSLVLAALNVAGLQDITLISEPEAAALHYASQTRVEDGSTIAVYDLGGGTFDTAILRKAGAGNFELLGRPDGIETLGGADFDAAVLRHVMGHVSTAAEMDPTAPETLAALSRLRRECREAKEALSMDSESSVAVSLPGTQQSVRLVRAEFEAMIEEPLRETVEALQRSLRSINVDPQDLSTVLLIGGSSRIPLVAGMISVELGRPIAVDADPKSSICLGAAVAAWAQAGEGNADAASAAVGSAERSVATRPHVASRAPALGALKTASAKTGRHAPRPRARMAAAAAVAATVLTIATATAAQSPDGNGLLATMFGNQAADVMRDGGAQASGAQAGGAGAGKAAETPASGNPAVGLEASARTGVTRAGNVPGNGAGKSPARSGTGNAGTGAGTAAGSAAGQVTGSTPGTATGGTGSTATPATPGTGTPAAPGTTPPPATTPDPDPTGGAASGPTPPTTNPTTPPPVAEPTTPPTTPADPVTPPPPPPSPEPTVPQPEPTITQDPPPPPPAPEPTQDPVTPPATTDPAPLPTETAPVPDPALLSAV